MLLLLLAANPAHAAVETLTSPQGVHFWLAKDETQPMFTLRLVFTSVGTAYDPQATPGLANVASTMIAEGAGDMDALAFKQALDAQAIKLSTAADADHFYITLTSLSEHQQDALALLTTVLTQPRFDADALARVKGETLTSLKRAQEQPRYLASRAWSEQYFGTHPYSKPNLGTKEGVEYIGESDLRAYCARAFTQKNMLVSVAGDVDAKQLGASLDALAARLPASFTPLRVLEDIVPPAAAAAVAIEKDIPQTVVQFGGLGLKRSDPRYIAAFVLNEIIGGTALTSRMGEEIREKSGLTYSIGTDLIPLQWGGVWIGMFATRRDKADEALAKLEEVMNNVAAHGVTAKELADAKAYLIGSFPLSLDTNGELVGFMTGMQINGLGADYLEKRNALIQAVTREEVNALAKDKLTFAQWHVVRVGGK